uniref:Uncharacterized protein n=1 Tax=Arundo donax TaxID=35708 RepID=A0A0A9H0D4_ARUDO
MGVLLLPIIHGMELKIKGDSYFYFHSVQVSQLIVLVLFL